MSGAARRESSPQPLKGMQGPNWAISIFAAIWPNVCPAPPLTFLASSGKHR